MTEFGVARREFFTTQLSKNAYDANALTTDVAISWVDEAGVIPTVSVTLTQTELKLKKLAAIAVMSRELLEDEEIDLIAFIAGRVAEGFAKAEDQAFFNGGGTGADGSFTGLLQNTDIEEIEFVDKATITVEKIYEMIDTLPAGAHGGAKFYFNRTIMSQIRLLQDGDSRYIYQNPLEVSGTPTLAGYPVVLVESNYLNKLMYHLLCLIMRISREFRCRMYVTTNILILFIPRIRPSVGLIIRYLLSKERKPKGVERETV